MKTIGNTIKKVIKKGLVGALIISGLSSCSINENRLLLIKKYNFLDREYLFDKNGDGTVDEHYRIIDTLRPYHFCLRRMPLEVTEKDQNIYENLIKEEK